jgi:hypothetical protein
MSNVALLEQLLREQLSFVQKIAVLGTKPNNVLLFRYTGKLRIDLKDDIDTGCDMAVRSLLHIRIIKTRRSRSTHSISVFKELTVANLVILPGFVQKIAVLGTKPNNVLLFLYALLNINSICW